MISRLGLVAVLVGGACGGEATPATPDVASERINTIVPGLADSVFASTGFLANSTSLSSVFDSLSVVDSLVAGEEQVPVALADEPTEEEIDGQALADFLAQNIFTEDNYEGDGVFLVRGAPLCEDDFDPVACASDIDNAEIRLRVTEAGSGLDIELLIGPERFEPLSLELRDNSLALVVDLRGITNAAIHLNEVGGGDPLDVPDVIEGVVAARLTVHGPEAITVEFGIRRAVRIEGPLEDGGGTLALSSEASDPLWLLSADAANESATFLLDVGTTSITLPYNQVNSTSLNSDPFVVTLQGLEGTITVTEGDTQLVIEDMSLGSGESTVERGATKLVGVELPAFTLTADPVAQTLAFDPAFDLTVDLDMRVLADEGEDIAGFMLNDTYNLTVTDTIHPIDETLETPGGIEVVSGSLLVSSDDTTVTVNAGSCLLGVDTPPDGSHELLGHLAAGSCP